MRLWTMRESEAQGGGAGGDGGFSARVRFRRSRLCGGTVHMLGRRVCRRWCSVQNIKKHP